MTADVIKFHDAAALFERDRKANELLLFGHTEREVAATLKCSVEDVRNAMIRMTGDVSPQLRARTIQLDLARCDKMLQGFLEDALPTETRRGSFDAGVMVLRIMQHHDRLLGLAPQPRGDSPLEDGLIKQTSTEQLQNAIDRLTGKTDRTIDGEVVAGKEGSDG